MGGRFWIGLVGAVVAIGIGGAILFLILEAAIIAWGVLGAFVAIGGIALGIAWVYDRRRQAQYDDLR